jgi:serine/threonine protein kinase/Flp pilus assembly protein TadD
MDEQPSSHEQDDLSEVLVACLEAEQTAGNVKREEMLARYPQFAVELERFFAQREQFDKLAAPLREIAKEPQTATAPLLESGLLGDFRLIREVGRGGMGVVFEAEQISLGRRVALKVLPFAATMVPRQLVRFQNEARAAASLEHPHIVPVYGVGCERGVHYYAMKFIEGQTVAALIAQQRRDSATYLASGGRQPPDLPLGSVSHQRADASRSPQSTTAPAATARTERAPRDAAYFRRAAEWGIQAAEALEHAHSLGIVHRDIKPANLMIDGQGKLWVTDFGLARTATDAGLTMTGDVLGTLRYMSPEQAQASHGLVDHRTDVYSLGVTLYEMLTGRPAVEGKGREEILNAITLREPRPLRRLDSAIPQDLETIVLKAMEKNPTDRYAAAKELNDDLQHFLEDRPIRARRPSTLVRARKWGRRHRAVAVAAVVCLLITSLAVAGSLGWVAREGAVRRAAIARVIASALDESQSWQAQRRLPEALSATRRAKGLLAGADVDDALREKVMVRLADLELLDSLENIRLEEGTAVKDGHFDWEWADTRYTEILRNAGLDALDLPPEEAGERIRSTTVAAEIAAVLDDWLPARMKTVGRDNPSWKQLLRVARAADPDPWRTRVREAIEREDWKGLRELAVSDEVLRLTPATLSVVGADLLADAENDSLIETFLRESQRRHPNDYWLNHNLFKFYCELHPPKPEQALPFAVAAVALRPDSPGAHGNLGLTLKYMGRHDEAIAEYHEVVRLAPKDSLGHNNLGSALLAKGRLDEAIEEYRAAVSLDPGSAMAHCNLGSSLQEKSRVEHAIAEYREAIRLQNNFAEAHYNLGNALRSKNQLDEAAKEYLEAIRIKENHAEAWCNLGNTLLDQKKPRDAEAACRNAIKFNPELFNAYNSLGAALYRQEKLPQAVDAYRKAIDLKPDFALAYSSLGSALRRLNNLSQAEAACRKAIELDSHFAEAHYNLGLILHNQRKIQEAEAAYRMAIELKRGFAEAHCNLGHALREQGRFADALAELKEGDKLGSPWNYPSSQWVREADQLLRLDVKLPKILKGELQPADVGERLALANMCREYKSLYLAAFCFYRDAFVEQPNLAHDLQNQHRYNAARAAALAGSGQGKADNQADDNERARLRPQALEWLRADLAAYSKLLDEVPDKAAAVTRQRMQHRQQDRDFVGFRDPEALAKLPEAEQTAWRQLWADVAAMLERTQPKPGTEKRPDTK